MRYHDLDICGFELGPYPEDFYGPRVRVCYGKPGHPGPHGNQGPCAELLLKPEEFDRLSQTE